MSFALRRSPFTLIALTTVLTAASVTSIGACATDEAPSTNTPAGGGDAGTGSNDEDGGGSSDDDASATEDSGKDETSTPAEGGACGTTATTNGETCIGYGTSGSSNPCAGCSQPFGYVCFGGGPPNITGCREVSKSVVGNSYCCPMNACVAQPDQDPACNGTAGKPHRFQCPPMGAGHVAPAAGCVEVGSGGSSVEKFYCCP